MEVFGTPKRGYKVTEKDAGSFDSTNIRNSYPLSKQLCENLCCSYAMEYGVPTKIVRLSLPLTYREEKDIFFIKQTINKYNLNKI